MKPLESEERRFVWPTSGNQKYLGKEEYFDKNLGLEGSQENPFLRLGKKREGRGPEI